jgi:hypothetical protein
MSYTPTHLAKWTHPADYVGASWPDYYSSGFGQSRDSDALERSNFRCALAALGGESETVVVVRESHWAVGWVEWIAIHQSDGNALRTADTLCAACEEYSVLDEDDYSREEQEEANEVWLACYSPFERVAYIRRHRGQFDFVDYADLLGCVRGKYFAGYASDLIY